MAQQILQTITVTINSRKVECAPDQTILEAANRNGISIPNLCHEPRLKPYGACRMCLVEVENSPKLVASCASKVAPGMVINTNTEKLVEYRKKVLRLLLSNHPRDCMTCEKAGKCQLETLSYLHGIRESGFNIEPKPEVIPDPHPAIERDQKKCILCGRCVRICDEVQGAGIYDFKSRGFEAEISTFFDLPLLEAGCESCGQCVSTCPTGAIIDKRAKGKGRELDFRKTVTTCPYCGVGCQLELNIHKQTGELVSVTSPIKVTPNHGNLCIKGRFGIDFIQHPDRLTTPLIRKEEYKGKSLEGLASPMEAFQEADWDEALDLVAQRFRQIREESGSDTMGFLSSAKTSNEENYLMQKFARAVMGTNNVDHCARLCHASTVAGLAASFGSGAMTNSIGDIDQADLIFITGSNTTEAHPVIGSIVRQAVRQKGAKLIVADPRKISLTREATMHLQQRCGTDVALLNGLMHIVIKKNLHDKEFIANRTEDFEKLEKIVNDYPPELVSKITGIPKEDILEAAHLIGSARSMSVLYSMGITQHTTGTDNVKSIANLAMLTGNLGRPGAGVNPLRGQSNVQGACDLGALPNVYPGYQKVHLPEINKKFEEAWGTKLSDKPGLTIVEMIQAAERGDIKSLYIMGENPMISDPDITHVAKALLNLDFLVVQDIFLTETAQLADVVLPAASFAEKDGAYTNTERRVRRLRKALLPPGKALADWEIISRLANKMGYKMDYSDPGQILDEINRVTPIYGGITWKRVSELNGLQWPCPDEDHPGTPILHVGKFTRGKGLFHPVTFLEAKELPDEEYPFILTTGRVREHFHTGSMSRRAYTLDHVYPTGTVEIHPEDAHKLGISDGDKMCVESRRGKVELPAQVVDRTAPGTVFLAFHFKEAPANRLTIAALDPQAKIPEFKVCAVRVGKA